MLLKNNQIYNLNHRAYFLRGQNNRIIITASTDGRITFIDLETGNLNSIGSATGIRDISVSKLDKLIALIDSATGNLVIIDFDGRVVFWDTPPSEVIFPDDSKFSGFQSCFFDETGKNLWCVARLAAADEVEFQLRQISDWSIVDKVAAEDPYSLSHYSFYATGENNVVALWISGEQDGSDIWWLQNDNDTIKYREEPKLQDSTPPEFLPAGSEFIVQYNHESFRQFRYPGIEQIGEYYLELGEDDMVGYYSCYLNEKYALLNSENGLVFLVDTKQRKIIEEVTIENHAPMPVPHYYPRLRNEDGLCTDLGYFEGVGDYVVFVFRRNSNAEIVNNSAVNETMRQKFERAKKDLENWQDALIVIPKSKFLAELSA
jgi:WD40 repeat protein